MQIGPKTEAAIATYLAVRAVNDEINEPFLVLERKLHDTKNVRDSLLRALEAERDIMDDGASVLVEWRAAVTLCKKLERERYPYPGDRNAHEHNERIRTEYLNAFSAAVRAFEAEHLGIAP